MYMSPEGLLKGVLPNKCSDMWSMCAALVEVCEGGDFWEVKSDDAESDIVKMMKKESKTRWST